MGSGIKTYENKAYVKNSIGRLIVAAIAITLEIYILFRVVNQIPGGKHMELAERIGSIIVALLIYNRRRASTMRVPWIFLVLVFPIFGTMMYLVVGFSGSMFRMRRRFNAIDRDLYPLLPETPESTLKYGIAEPSIANISKYIGNYAHYPMYNNSDVEYYGYATDAFEAQKEALRKAKKFIFMEYHAIEDAEAFRQLEEVLIDRVNHGVEVRLFYDDVGSISFLNYGFAKRMRRLGIQCRVFNPVTPVVNLFLNNRDHRKITVIDGEVAFTGGYNLANEYFNITHPYGFWKDTGVKVTGPAVNSFTIMFLEMWNAIKDTDKDDTNIEQYLPALDYEPKEHCYIQPYADNPIDNEQVGENVYIALIERAERYIYFVTPYLIITDEMRHALCLAAKKGVDVRIITPGIPDKKLTYSVTRANYEALVLEGVRIFEYSPGFCHAKMCVSDDIVATCGTINLDYRSLYHHFENGCLIYGAKAVGDIKEDFERMFNVSEEVTDKYKSRPFIFGIWCIIMQLIAPLL